MKTKLLATAALFAVGLSHPAAAQLVALTGGNVVDLDGKAAIRDAVVIVDGDRIRAIGPAASTPVPEGATIVPLGGKWLIPGLMNMHVHLGLNLPGAGRLYNDCLLYTSRCV